MKRCWTSLVIREIQIKTMIWCHCISIRIAKIKKDKNTKSGQVFGTIVTLTYCWQELESGTATPENSLAVSYKVKYALIIWPRILLLGVFPRELTVYVHSKTCAWMFIAALFTVAPNQKQPKCPSTGECINKLWYTCTMKYHLANKRVWTTDIHNNMTES